MGAEENRSQSPHKMWALVFPYPEAGNSRETFKSNWVLGRDHLVGKEKSGAGEAAQQLRS